MRIFRRLSIATLLALLTTNLTGSPAWADSHVEVVNCSGGGTFTITSNVVTGHESCRGAAEIPEGVTSIGERAFYTYPDMLLFSRVESVSIPSTVTTIGAYAFATVGKLTYQGVPEGSVTIPQGVTSIGLGAFQGSMIEVVFGGVSELTSIPSEAFSGAFLTSITIPKSVTTIDSMAFENSRLGSVIFEEDSQLTSIRQKAFAETRIRTITIPNRVEEIYNLAFYKTSLTSVSIPSSVRVIAVSAFMQSGSLTSVTFNGNAPWEYVSGTAFSYIGSNPVAYITASATGFGDGATWKGLRLERTGDVSCSDGGTFEITANVVTGHSGCAGSAVIPGSVTTINDDAFQDATLLTSVTIPSSVISIGTDERLKRVTFDAQSGTSVATVLATSVTSAPATTRTGYTFQGWFIAASGGTAITFPYAPSADITLYAQWQQITYNVTFDAQSGSSVSLQNTASVATSPTTTRTGYTFRGWFLAASGGTARTFPYSPSADVTLYAQWQQTHNVTFDAQSGSTVALQNTASVATSPATTQAGFIFQGWFDAATYGTEITFPYAPSADITLYAQWQQITYNVTFDAQSGSSVSIQNTASVAASPTTTRTGYTFQGWFIAASGGTAITFPYAPSVDITIYAQWVSATPPTPRASEPFAGPLLTTYSDRTPAIGDEVVVSGLRLNLVTSCTIDGVKAEITNHSADSLTILIPAGLEPGIKDLVISTTAGTLTSQGAFTVESKPAITESPALSSKVNSGSFNGYVAVYAKGHAGKTLAWKIAGKWFKTTVSSDYQVFQRRTAAVGIDVDVHLYIDGEKQLTKTVTTR